MIDERARAVDAASYPSLGGRPVIVTGGASGIGEAIVRAFAAQDALTGFLDIDAEAGRALADELGGDTVFERCDLKDIDALNRAIDAIEARHGPTRVLINNAANDTRHDWREVTPDYFDDRIAVNLRHAFFAAQKVAPGMIAAGGGSIVNFGSVSWMIAQHRIPIYQSAKAGVHGLTRALARELGKDNIRVNTIVPGWVMTQRQIDLWVSDEALAQLDKDQCLTGRVMPEDMARMTLFLAADDSRMCSAQNFIVDGGHVHG